jgi:hypothetical protein
MWGTSKPRALFTLQPRYDESCSLLPALPQSNEKSPYQLRNLNARQSAVGASASCVDLLYGYDKCERNWLAEICGMNVTKGQKRLKRIRGDVFTGIPSGLVREPGGTRVITLTPLPPIHIMTILQLIDLVDKGECDVVHL